MSTTMVHVRMDKQTKVQAANALAEMGLSISDAVRVFLTRVAVEKQIPFPIKIPNAETRRAMAEADKIAQARHARFKNAAELFNDLEKNNDK